MPELLPLQLGAFGVLCLVVYFIFRTIVGGGLMPRATVDALLAARDAEIVRSNERADEWHTAYESERHITAVKDAQISDLLVVARTVEHVMESLEILAASRSGP